MGNALWAFGLSRLCAFVLHVSLVDARLESSNHLQLLPIEALLFR